MAIDKGKQLARWQRNKRDERRRKSEFPREVSTRFIEAILAERNRRITETSFGGEVIRPGHFFFAPGSYEKAITFLANVWAADAILMAEWGPKGAKPSRVARWLDLQDIDHGYSDKSLPKMIRQARTRVRLLEQPLGWNGGKPLWPPFVVDV